MPDVSRFSSYNRRFTGLVLSCILIVFASLSLYQINLPGLHYDEAFEAVPALQLLQNRPVTLFRNHGLVVAGQVFPLMTQDYIGAINTYLVLPFIAMFGAAPAALRVMSIIVGAITLWLAYALCSQLTGQRWVGLATVLLLAVDPTFVFWSRQGIFVTAITAAIGLAATLCWLRYLRRGSTRWAVAGAFLFGLGIYAKFLFVWLIAALIGAAILLNWARFTRTVRQFFQGNLRSPSTKEIIWMVLAFLLGCWPLIVYNLQTGGTILSITENAETSYYGVNNLAIGPNLLERLSQFRVMINGRHLWYLGDIWGTLLPSFAFGLVLVLVVVMTIRSLFVSIPTSGQPSSKITLFPFLVIGLVILFSTGTVSALWVTHFALLMPWPSIAIAIGSWFVLAHIRSRPMRYLILWVGLILLVGHSLVSTLRYHTSLAESGGLSSHSDAVYALSAWLALKADGPVAAMDWGLAAPVTYLTASQVTPGEVFGYAWESDEELTARLADLIAQPATRYLWRAPDEIIFDRSPEFKGLYRPLYLEENIEEAFYERSGRPLFGVTRLVKCGTPGIISPEPADHCPQSGVSQ